MHCLKGRPVSPGYAEGTAVVYDRRTHVEVPRYQIERSDVEAEHHRLHDAIERSHRDLKRLESHVLAELGQAQSAIFSAHLALLRDTKFVDGVRGRISRDLVNVEQALDAEIADLCNMLASVENEYLRERAQDIRDVGNRVMQKLTTTGHAGPYFRVPPESIIVAYELLPSETIDLDRQHVIGIVTEEGGENSHAAILARALGIPAVTGVTDASFRIASGAMLLVDGENGVVTVTPSENAVHDFELLRERYDKMTSLATASESLDCVTRDGIRISLHGNVSRSEEAHLVTAHRMEGVGLFRTEFMFMDSVTAPNFDRQLEVYKELIDVLGGRPLTIRTLDLGGDKLPSFRASHHEANPNLGLRGLRFSLAERAMLETQLRAIVAASRYGNVRVLFPMVLGASDLATAIEMFRAVAAELGVDNVPPVGAMIETPAALFALDEIFALADFVSIGTNDLTQFMLAADRNAAELADDYSVLHPAVLRAIRTVVEASRDAGCELSVCGEAAGDPNTACLLVGLGIRQLSVSPLRAARVRYSLRRSVLEELECLARQTLHSDSPQAVRALFGRLSETPEESVHFTKCVPTHHSEDQRTEREGSIHQHAGPVKGPSREFLSALWLR